MPEPIRYTDLVVSEYEIGLTRLIGKSIKEIRGYLSEAYSDVAFKLTKIEFTDGTFLMVEAEHDYPYLVQDTRQPQPNFDDDMLERLMAESQEDTDKAG